MNIYTTYQQNNKQLYIGAMDNYGLANIQVIEGRLPEAECEIAISQSALEYIGSKKLGDYIDLTNYNLQGKYRIIGIINDFLKTNTIYSFDNSTASQKILDGLIQYDEDIIPIITNILIQFDKNVNDDQINIFMNENSLNNYQYNGFVYEDNQIIVPNNNIDLLFYILIIVVILSFISTFICFYNTEHKLFPKIKCKATINSVLIKSLITLFLINMILFIGIKYINVVSMQNKVNILSDFTIGKTAEFSRSALRIPVNLYDGITEIQYNMIKENEDIEDTHSIKSMPVNLIDNSRKLEEIFPKIQSGPSADKYNEALEQYNYNVKDNIYTCTISFLNQNELDILEKYNNIKFDYNKLQSGQEFIILTEQDQSTLSIGDTMHFTQIVHPFNSINYHRIDFESDLGYLLYYPNELADLFNNEINIVMSSESLKQLGIDLPYTTVSIKVKDPKNDNSIKNLLKSFVRYKGNSTIGVESKSEQSASLKYIMITSLIITLASILYLLYDFITILIFQAKKEFNKASSTIFNFITGNMVMEVIILELVAIMLSLPVYFLLKHTIDRMFLG